MIKEHEVTEMRAQGDFAAYRAAVARAAMDLRRTRKAAVLAHPDLAEQLREAPLCIRDPLLWTGYVPSETVEAKQSQQLNMSPYRAQVVALVAEAQRRDGRDYGVNQ